MPCAPSIGKGLSLYGQLPSYKAMFEREGVNGPADVAVVGSRAEVIDRVAALADAGVTDFAPSEYCLNRDEWAATREVLVQLAANNSGALEQPSRRIHHENPNCSRLTRC
jgi:hypothetical protein